MHSTITAEKPNWFARIFTPLLAAFLVYIFWGEPEGWQRMLLSLALYLSYSATLTGYNHKNRNWLDDGVVGFYSGLMGATWGTLLSWEDATRFWDKSLLIYLLVLILVTLFTGMTAFRTPRGSQSQLVNAKTTFASIGALLVLGVLGAYFRPEMSIAQIGAFIILIGFFAQPFAPSERLLFVPFLTLKRLSFFIVILLVLADWVLK